MGLHTADEMRDIYDAGMGEDGAYVVTSESLRAATPGAEQSSIQGAAVIDAGTGEIIQQQDDARNATQSSAQNSGSSNASVMPQQQQGGPTFEDAMAAVQAGDFDTAADIARSLPEGQHKAIEAPAAGPQQGDAQQAKPVSRRGNGGQQTIE